MSWRGRCFWSAYSAPKKVPPALVAELGQQVPDLGEVLGRVPLVDDVAHELAELVELEQARGLAVERREQARAGGDAVAAEVALQPGGDRTPP